MLRIPVAKAAPRTYEIACPKCKTIQPAPSGAPRWTLEELEWKGGEFHRCECRQPYYLPSRIKR